MKPAATCVAVMMLWSGLLAAAAEPDKPEDKRRSGFDFMTREVQAIQRDDAQNPAMLWVQEGAAAWDRPQGRAQRACAACHGAASEAASRMKGVAARYPAFDSATQRPITLAQRINACRVSHQQADALAPESQELLALETLVAMQSRGMTIAPPDDPRLLPFRERGERLFRQRIGQLDLSCAQCHDERAGGKLAGATIPQAHPTGYPIYRLEWQGVGSLQRRLRGCIAGVRAEPFPYGAAELTELELYLMQRAAGMAIETPAVRP
ncbi:MAG TPA: sulfur oxidation c-type cytochrome SoxA [Burkholderiaceae bacterium]|nr:sulfur oxidation c-type cytochrome SoxA [Burkholderiaceae bacterium]